MNKPLPSAARAAACFVIWTTFSTAVLVGQQAPAPASRDAEEKKDELQTLDRFVVTGSYIPTAETAIDAGVSPVIRIDRLTIAQTGVTNTTELLQQLPIANANSVPVSNNATGFTPGASAISLRGLGPEATLILLNGRRIAMYPVGVGGSTAFVDLNSIPLAAIDSIEILKDGASSIYGADAVAGVINIKMRRGIDGSEAHVSYGNTVAKDSAEVVANIATGATTPQMNVIVGANYSTKAGIMNRDRSYSAVPPFLSTNSSPANLELSRFAVAAALGQSVNAPIPGVPINQPFFFGHSGAVEGNTGSRPASQYSYSLGRTSTYNYNEVSMTYPEIERKGAFGSVERKLFKTDNIKAHLDLLYQNVTIENQLASTATGDFTSPVSNEIIIPARTPTPILTVVVPLLGGIFAVAPGTVVPPFSFAGPGTQIINGTAQRLAPAGAYNPFNPFNQDIADGSRARLTEFGNRINETEIEAFMFNTGIKAENIASRWNFEVGFSFSSIEDQTRSQMTSASRFNDLLNANSPIFDPRSSDYVGTSTPYNPFGYYRDPIPGNAALADYGRVRLRHDDRSTLGQLSFVVSTAELFKLPHGGLGLAIGGDYRREQLTQEPDNLSTSRDIIGESPRAVTVAQRKIGGVFAEGRLPMGPWMEGSASIRHEKFFSSGRDVAVPKFGLRVRPLGNQLTLRTSYSKGFREPSLYELYSSPITALVEIQDPFDGFVEPEQPVTLRGNRNLEAEKTDYLNAGFVWTPTIYRLKGLSLGADYWEVTRKGTVEANPQWTVYREYGLIPGGPLPGESVLFTSSGFIAVVNSLFFNVGRTEASGWDFSAAYQLPTDTLGRWEFMTVWAWTRRFKRAAVEGVPVVDVLGLDSTGSGDNGFLEWRGRVNLNWAYKGFSVFVSGNYMDGFEDEDANGNVRFVDDTFTMDAQVSYSFRQHRKWFLRDTKVSVGARNILDRDPPLAIGGGQNSTGYPGHLYNAENLFWYAGVTRKF